MKILARLFIVASLSLVLTGCEQMELRDIIERLVLGEEIYDSFIMGDGSYGPNVEQKISYEFEISKYEITYADFSLFIADAGYVNSSYWTSNGWQAKIDAEPDWAAPAFWVGASDRPVIGVSWYEAVAYCNWRSVKEGLTPVYDTAGRANLKASGWRLPTDVEWEYAAAKGAPGQSERIFAYGDQVRLFNVAGDALPRPPAVDDQIDQAVGAQPIGSMHADTGALPGGVQSLDPGAAAVGQHPAVIVGGDPAHGVVSRGLHRNR